MTTANDDVRCHPTRSRLFPALCATLSLCALGSCQSSECTAGLGCARDASIDRMIEMSVAVSHREFKENQAVTVWATARNKSRSSYTIPVQRCSEPVIMMVDTIPVTSLLICDGNAYPGATLAPGDSVVWTRSLIPIIRGAFGMSDPGPYCFRSQARGDDRKWVRSKELCVQILDP